MMKVVNKRFQSYDVYIGRGSIWGNPFIIGPDGTRAQVIAKYEVYARNNKAIMKNLPTLKDKVLGCFCAPLPCHGDILIKLYDELIKKNSSL